MDNVDCPGGCKRQTEVANDNVGIAALDSKTLDEPVFRLARLLGRQIAREHFASIQAANDNRATAESNPKT
jgi:hypothetical protein